MTSRTLAAIAVAFLLIFLVCSGQALALFLGGATAANGTCYTTGNTGSPTASPTNNLTPAADAPIGRWSTDQVANAATIIEVGEQLGIPARGWVIALATAMQEASLLNPPVGDRESIGLFQQRPSQGWGSPAQLRDPSYAATKFYQKLQTITGWQSMPLTEAAQLVQRSAYPDAYAKWETDATQLVENVVSGDPRAIQGVLEQCASICPSASAMPAGTSRPCVETSDLFERARSWLTAWSSGPVPYLSSNLPGDLFHGYRRDCSGYVSMAFGLPGPGLDTIQLAERSRLIGKFALQPGDLMINPDSDLRGHVVLFAGWADAAMISYFGYEQSGDGGTHYRKIPYPYFGSYPMSPYRLRLGTINGE